MIIVYYIRMLIHDLGSMKIVPALLLLLRCPFMNIGAAADDRGGAPLSRTADSTKHLEFNNMVQ